jgi:hypothetical protein
MTMKTSSHKLIEWPMTKPHYEVDWPKVRNKLGDHITNWLLELDPIDGQVVILHQPKRKRASLVAEFYNKHTEDLFVSLLIG